jgi:hypothetical protein
VRVLRGAGPAVLQMERRILLIQVRETERADETKDSEFQSRGAIEQCLHSCTSSLTATGASWLNTTAARQVRYQ